MKGTNIHERVKRFASSFKECLIKIIERPFTRKTKSLQIGVLTIFKRKFDLRMTT